MRLALAALLLVSLISSSNAQCERSNEIVGRWRLVDCYSAGLGDCTFDASREWHFRADGSWIERRGGEIVGTGTWCTLDCDPDLQVCEPGRGTPYLQITDSSERVKGFAFDTCTNAEPGRCPFMRLPDPLALSSRLAFEGEITNPVFAEVDDIWKYIGDPVLNDGSSWGAVKGMFR